MRDGVRAGRPPTVREVQAALGFAAVQSAKAHLDALIADGQLAKIPGARGFALPGLARAAPLVHVPILGRVAAGALTTASEEHEGTIAIEARRPGGETHGEDELFALRVRGHSMRDAGILHGDLVIVQRQTTARDGDIVVALVGDEATVKTLRRRPGRLELVPANPDFTPIVIRAPEEALILGKVIEVRRQLDGTSSPKRR